MPFRGAYISNHSCGVTKSSLSGLAGSDKIEGHPWSQKQVSAVQWHMNRELEKPSITRRKAMMVFMDRRKH